MRSSRSLPGIGLSCLTAVLLLRSPATAEEIAKAAIRTETTRELPKAFGIEDYTVTIVPAIAFLPSGENQGYGTLKGLVVGDLGRYGPNNTVQDFYAPVYLPAGIRIEYIGLNSMTDSPNAIGVALYNRDRSGDVGTIGTFGSTIHGWGMDYNNAPFTSTLFGDFALIVHVQQGNFPTPQFFGSVEIWWRRVVSPSPSQATFNDVPLGHPIFQFVEALAQSGITVGCGGNNYCPDASLTRGQMAVFLAKALGLHAGRSGPPS